MQKSKFLALLLAVAMVVSMVVVPAYAATEGYSFTLTPSSTTVAAGGEVTVTLAAVANPGIAACDFLVTYSDGWTLTAVDTTEGAANLDGASFVAGQVPDTDGSLYVVYECGTGDGTGTGNVMTLTFTAPETAGKGTISVEFEGAIEGVNYSPLAIDTLSTEITVEAQGGSETTTCEYCGVASTAYTHITADNVATYAAGATLAAGHYVLDTNVDLTGSLTVAEGTTVCVDLNGKNISAKAAVCTFKNEGTLSIMDSGENGTIQASESVNATTGANVYTATGTFNLYGGTISGGHTVTLTDGYAPSAISYTNGGNLYVNSGTANIYGGTITGGYARRGGNIYVNNGTLNMYGGTVTEGVADRGGNIYGDATINIYGGTVSKGVGGWGGANLFTYGSSNTINVYGGSILDGGCKENKGNAIHSVYSNINIYGGTISNLNGKNPAGTARTNTIASSGSASSGNANTHFYGGTVVGAMNLGTSATSNVVYNGRFSTDISAYLADCACMELVDSVYVAWNYDTTCTDCAYEAALTADASNDAYSITQEAGAHTPAVSETSSTGYACAYCKIEVAAPTNIKEGTCAHGDHGTVTWLPWDGAATDGHYYVEAGMTLSGQITVASGEVFCLDLNGQTVTAAAGKRMFEISSGATFNLMDLAGEGKLVGSTNTTTSGAVVRSANAFNFYSGTIVGGHVSVDSVDNYYGGAVYISGGTFNMTGGTITGGKVTNTSTGTAAGGNVYLTGGSTSVISGGVIENGEAGVWGGNISVNTGAQVTISGTVIIRNGTASLGDNIYVRGASSTGVASRMEIREGATIAAGATEAADIYVNTNPAELAVYEGATLAQDVKEFLACEAQLEDISAGNYITYATLDAALEAAEAGDAIVLGTDASTDAGLTLAGIDLDLNGNALTVNGAFVAAVTGTDVIDSVGGGSITATSVSFAEANPMLPVTVDGVTVLENPTVSTGFLNDNEFYFYFNELDEDTQIPEALKEEGNTLDIQIVVSVDGVVVGTFTLRDNGEEGALSSYASNWDTKALLLTLTGVADDAVITCEIQVASCGATVAAVVPAE